MAKQRIDGDNNVQVGRVDGDLTIGQDDPLDPGNPNLVECPSCWKLASRYASPCPRCGFPVAEHFAALVRERQRKQVQSKATVCAVIFLVSMMATTVSWLPEALRMPLTVIAVLSALLATGFSSHADKLK